MAAAYVSSDEEKEEIGMDKFIALAYASEIIDDASLLGVGRPIAEKRHLIFSIGIMKNLFWEG